MAGPPSDLIRPPDDLVVAPPSDLIRPPSDLVSVPQKERTVWDALFGRTTKPYKSALGFGGADDAAGSVVAGVGQLAEVPGVLYGLASGDMDNVAYRYPKMLEDFGDTLKSPALRQKEKDEAERLSHIKGFGPGLVEGARGILNDPQMLASNVVAQLPQLGASLFGAKLLPKVVAGIRGAPLAEKAAERTAIAGASGTGATIQGSQQGRSTYEDVMDTPQEVIETAPAYRELIDQGATPEEARERLAVGAARFAAATAAAISAGTMAALPGVEKSIIRGQGARGATSGFVRGAAGEALQETLETGGGQMMQNLGVQEVDPSRSAWEGVGTQAGQAGVIGGAMGGIGGVGARRAAPHVPGAGTTVEPEPPPAVPPAPPSVGATIGLYQGDRKAPVNVVVEGYSPDGLFVDLRAPDNSITTMRSDQFAEMAGEAVKGAPMARVVAEPPPEVTQGPPITDYELSDIAGETEEVPPRAVPRKDPRQTQMNVPDMDEAASLRRRADTFANAADIAEARGSKSPEEIALARKYAAEMRRDADLLEGQRKAPTAVPYDEGSEGAARTAAAADASRLGQLGRVAREPGAPEPRLPPLPPGPDRMGALGQNAPERAGEPGPVDETRGKMGPLGQTAGETARGEPAAGDFYERGRMGQLGMANVQGGRDPGGNVYTPPVVPQGQLQPQPKGLPKTAFARPEIPKGRKTLLEFIASLGGLKNTRGDLTTDADKWHLQKPFRRRLINDATGVDVEEAARKATEAGYLETPFEEDVGVGAQGTNRGRGERRAATAQELIDAMEQELRGTPVYDRDTQAIVDAQREWDAGVEADQMEADRRADLSPEEREREDLVRDLRDLGEDVDVEAALEELRAQLDERLAIIGAANVDDALAALQQAEQAYIDEWATDPRYGEDPNANPDDWFQYAEEAAIAERGDREGDQAPQLAAETGEQSSPEPGAQESVEGGGADAGTDQRGAAEEAGPRLTTEERAAREADIEAARARDAEKVAALPTERTSQGAQGVLIPNERAAIQAQAARDSKGGLKGKGQQLAADQGMFAPSKKPDARQGDLEKAVDEAAEPPAVREAKEDPTFKSIVKKPDDDITLGAGFNPIDAFARLYAGLQAGTKAMAPVMRSAAKRAKLLRIATRRMRDGHDPLSVKHLGALDQFTILPASLASLDRRFASYFHGLLERTYMKERLEQQAVQAVQGYFQNLSAAERAVADKVFEYDRIMGIDRQATGADIVIRVPDKPVPAGRMASPRQFPLELSKPGELIHANGRTTKAILEARGFFQDRLGQFAEAIARKTGYQGPFLTEKNGRKVADISALKAEVARRTNPAERRVAERALQIAQDIEDMGRKGYFPLMRYGDWYIKVKPKDHITSKDAMDDRLIDGRFESIAATSPFEALTERARTKQGGSEQPDTVKERIEELKKRYPEADYTHEWGRISKDTFQDADIPALERLFNALSFNDPQLGAKLYQEVLDKVFEAQRAGIRKQARNIPGYSTDFSRAMADYARISSSLIADQMYAGQIDAAYEDIKKNSDPTVRAYTEAHRKYVEAPSNKYIAAALRAGFYQYIWGSPAAWIIQATQTPVITASQLGMIAGVRGGKMAMEAFGEVLGHIRPGAKGLTLDIGKLGRTPGERAMLKSLHEDGLLEPSVARDLQGDTFIRNERLREHSKKLKAIYDFGASGYNVVDSANRIAAALAYYRAAQSSDVRTKAMKVYERDNLFRESVGDRAANITPEALARFGAQETQFIGGRLNKSPIQQTWLGALAAQFVTYPMNYTRILSKAAWRSGPEGKMAALAMMAILTALGGMKGWPYAEDLLNVAEAGAEMYLGYDPMWEWRLRKQFGDTGWQWYAGEAAMNGLTRTATGADAGRRLGLGNIVPDMRNWYDAFPFMAATIGRIKDLEARNNTGQPQTMWANALQVATGKGGSDLMRANAMADEGVMTRGGKTARLPSEVSTGEMALKAIGFNPTDFARGTEQAIQEARMKQSTQAMRNKLLANIANNLARAADFEKSENKEKADFYKARAYEAIKENAERLTDPEIPQWQKIPKPTAEAIRRRVASYMERDAMGVKRAPKTMRQEISESPFRKPKEGR